MPKPFRVSDESINSYGCRVLNSGADTTAFESNPVMLFMHLRGTVIGKWENLKLGDDGAWYAEPVFDNDDDYAKAIGGKVEREFLRAASIGIEVLDAIWNDVMKCCDVIRWRLQEISIVDIGSNVNALQFYDQSGEPMTELKLASYLDQFKPTTQTPDTMPLETKALALALGMPETSTDAEVLNAITTRNADATKYKELQLTLETNQKNEAADLVKQAIADKRIPATAEQAYLSLFAASHDSAKLALAAIPAPQNLVQLATQSQSVQQATVADDAKKYHEMDKAGSLEAFKLSNPTDFNRMFEAAFGKQPDKLA
jgi:hypothetical protein